MVFAVLFFKSALRKIIDSNGETVDKKNREKEELFCILHIGTFLVLRRGLDSLFHIKFQVIRAKRTRTFESTTRE